MNNAVKEIICILGTVFLLVGIAYMFAMHADYQISYARSLAYAVLLIGAVLIGLALIAGIIIFWMWFWKS